MRTLAAIFAILLIWTAGLLAFASRVERSTPAADPPAADAVVALTGASNQRIDAAVALMEASKGKRLLISGVGEHVTHAQLQSLSGAAKAMFDCCVDLGFRAANTLGNARETAGWARAHHFRTLILVTADYHMPRARLELKAALPEAVITPYPVATNELKAADWWRTGAGAGRMIVEYCKYLAVLARETVLSVGAKPTPAANDAPANAAPANAAPANAAKAS
jgi:uncharacterized SAM-binding protein YcdF (DUF218 family)